MNKRRGHNEGSVYERKDANGKVVGYQGQITTPQRRRTVSGKTKKEVQRKMDEVKAAALFGKLGPSRSQTLREYLDGWLTTMQSSVKPSTYTAYRLNSRRVSDQIGRVRLDALTPTHFQDCYNALSTQGLAPRTVRQAHLTLHKAVGDAVRLDLMVRNVTEGVTLPRLAHVEQSWYSMEQLNKLFRTTEEERFHALWVVLGTTGLRLGEALGLKWSDMDSERRTLTVRRTLQRKADGGGLIFLEPKSKRSRRTIELGREASVALRAHRERQAFERKAAGDVWQENQLVFSTEIGTPMDQSRAHRHWRKAVEHAGIPRYRIHDLRHTVASHLTAAGMSAREVAEVLGHSSASLVLEVYGHVAPITHRKAADLMDALLKEQAAAI